MTTPSIPPSPVTWTLVREYRDIRFEHSGTGIAKVTINRPEVRNAFRPQTVAELIDAFARIRDDATIGCVLLTGEGEAAFCSGGDQNYKSHAGGYVGDVALRLYVAGDAACEPDFAATEEQLAEMAALVEQSLEAGALGYSMAAAVGAHFGRPLHPQRIAVRHLVQLRVGLGGIVETHQTGFQTGPRLEQVGSFRPDRAATSMW